MNPTTPEQTTVRQRLAQLATAWSGTNTSDRIAWQAWADAHPRSDSLGQSITLSGFAMYVSTNAALLASEFPAVTVPPASEPTWPSLALGLTMAATGGVVSATFSGLTAGYAIQVWVGGQLQAGRAYDHNLRLIDTIVPSDTSPINLATAYVARWGSPNAGARFHYAFRRIWSEGAIDVFLRNYGDTAA